MYFRDSSPGRGLDDLIDQASGTYALIRCRHINLKLAGHFIGSQPLGRSQTIFVGYYGQGFGAIGELPARPRDRQGEDDCGAVHRPVVVIFDPDYGVLGDALTNTAGGAFPFHDDDVDPRERVLGACHGD